jgi:hypothetical protein
MGNFGFNMGNIRLGATAPETKKEDSGQSVMLTAALQGHDTISRVTEVRHWTPTVGFELMLKFAAPSWRGHR